MGGTVGGPGFERGSKEAGMWAESDGARRQGMVVGTRLGMGP